MYRAYGLLQPGSDFTTTAAEPQFRARFPAFTVTRSGDRLSLVSGEWELKLWVNADPQVANETAGLAGKIAGMEPAEAAVLEACNRRVEVWSDCHGRRLGVPCVAVIAGLFLTRISSVPPMDRSPPGHAA